MGKYSRCGLMLFLTTAAVAAGCVVLVGCASPRRQSDTRRPRQSTIPEELERLARAFAAAPSTNRYDLGVALQKVLPSCPETSRRELGSGMFQHVIVARDHSKPSYFLYKSDVTSLLGPPDDVRGPILQYQIKRRNGMIWHLDVRLDHDYVVQAGTCGAQDKDAPHDAPEDVVVDVQDTSTPAPTP